MMALPRRIFLSVPLAHALAQIHEFFSMETITFIRVGGAGSNNFSQCVTH
jgi:hypothetical protein